MYMSFLNSNKFNHSLYLLLFIFCNDFEKALIAESTHLKNGLTFVNWYDDRASYRANAAYLYAVC